MNSVNIIGRLTRDPEVRYGQSGNAVARFTVAIDRGKDKNGNDAGADFPNILCFGKTAELVEKYVFKGHLIGIEGRIQTGSYESDGKKIYTTDVVANRIQFLEKKATGASETPKSIDNTPSDLNSPIDGFSKIADEDIPF